VDLRGGERLEGGQAERFGQRVDACVLEELVACLIDVGRVRVLLEISCAGKFAREVVACVQEFEEASNGVEVFVNKVNSALLATALENLFVQVTACNTNRNLITELSTSIRKPRTACQESLMSSQKRLFIPLPNQQSNHRRPKVVNVRDTDRSVFHGFFLEGEAVLVVAVVGSGTTGINFDHDFIAHIDVRRRISRNKFGEILDGIRHSVALKVNWRKR
jgi:hypothetical protein